MNDESKQVIESSSWSSMLLRGLAGLQWGPILAFFAIVIFLGIADQFFGHQNFLTFKNFRPILNSAALIAVPAMGMTMIIIAGGIDLSAGTALTLCSTIFVLGFENAPSVDASGSTAAVAGLLLIAILVGCACGAANGLLITGTKVVPFIVTLGTMTIFLGIGQILSGETTVTVANDKVPDWLSQLCHTSRASEKYLIPGLMIPTSVLIAGALAIIVGVLMNFTVFGRNVVAIGSNESTARLCGINVALTSLMVYLIAGVFTGIGGVMHYANVKSVDAGSGIGMELEIIAAVVLGGGSLSGGRGSILGTLFGALIITTIRSGTIHLSIPNTYSHIVIGVIIIVAVIVDQLRHGSPEWLFRMIRS